MMIAQHCSIFAFALDYETGKPPILASSRMQNYRKIDANKRFLRFCTKYHVQNILNIIL